MVTPDWVPTVILATFLLGAACAVDANPASRQRARTKDMAQRRFVNNIFLFVVIEVSFVTVLMVLLKRL